MPPANTSPLIRNLEKDEVYQTLNTANGYFEVNVPKGSKKLDLEIEIANPAPQINLSANISESKIIEKGVYNKILNNIEDLDWSKIKDDDSDLFLWQKKIKYPNVDYFLENIPKEKAAFYNVPDSVFKLENYNQDKLQNNFILPLNGEHVIYFYLGENENLDWQFFYNDFNNKKNTEPISVKIYESGNLVKIFTQENLEENSIELFTDNLEEGVYKMVLGLNEDVVINEITTKQKYFAFENNLNLANPEILNNFFIKGKGLKYYTNNQENSETLKFDGTEKEMLVSKIYNEDIKKKDLHKIELRNSNINLTTDGFIFINKETEELVGLLLKIRKIKTKGLTEKIKDMNCILASYDQPDINGGKIMLKTSFDLNNVVVDKDNKLKININMPGFTPTTSGVKFKNIKATIHRSFFNYLKSYF